MVKSFHLSEGHKSMRGIRLKLKSEIALVDWTNLRLSGSVSSITPIMSIKPANSDTNAQKRINRDPGDGAYSKNLERVYYLQIKNSIFTARLDTIL
jgi:hypothetical protein